MHMADETNGHDDGNSLDEYLTEYEVDEHGRAKPRYPDGTGFIYTDRAIKARAAVSISPPSLS